MWRFAFSAIWCICNYYFYCFIGFYCISAFFRLILTIIWYFKWKLSFRICTIWNSKDFSSIHFMIIFWKSKINGFLINFKLNFYDLSRALKLKFMLFIYDITYCTYEVCNLSCLNRYIKSSCCGWWNNPWVLIGVINKLIIFNNQSPLNCLS